MPTDAGPSTYLGVEFANMSYAQLAGAIGELAQKDEFAYIVTPNVDHIVQLNEGGDQGVASQFRDAYHAAHLRVCDSRIIQLLARWRGIDLEVVTGSDLTAHLFNYGHLVGRKVALIGGDDTILEDLQAAYPAVNIAQHRPPMGVLQNPLARARIVEFLVKDRFDIVFFAIGAPQSEIIAHQCLNSGRARGVALCIGASIDFLLGRKARAPLWMQRARLEWAFRLISEPRRLGRRYLLVGPRIFKLAVTLSSR